MKNKIIYTAIIVLSVALAAYCGYVFCTKLNIEDGGLPALIGVYIVALVFSVVVVDVFHEFGHFLVGAICRMGVKLPKIYFLSSSSIDVNPKGVKGIRGRMIATASAGSFFTLLLLALGIIALFAPSVSVAFCAVLPFAFYHFVLNVIPREYSGGKTDGLIVWEILKNEPTAQVMLSVLKVQGLMNKGVKLADVDESLLMDLPQLPEDDLNFIVLTQLRYEYYLARGNDGLAYKYFLRYKDLIKYLPSAYKK